MPTSLRDYETLNSSRSKARRITDVDIRLIRVFCGVVKCGGMAAAELELNIGRSTISRHVKDLEQRLDVTLCHRGRGGFSLTSEGRHAYRAAQQLLVALDQFQGDLFELRGRLTGQLSLALFDKTVTNPGARIHKAIAHFHDAAPDVDIDIHVEPVNDIERHVMEGSYLLGIIPTHRNSSSMMYLPLFDEQMYLYCGSDHPLFACSPRPRKADVLAQKYAGMGFHSPNMEVGSRLGWQRRATAYDQEAVATLILSGRYVGFLPDHYAAYFVQQGQMRRLGGASFQYRCEFAAVYRRAPKPSRLLSAFLHSLRAVHPPGPGPGTL